MGAVDLEARAAKFVKRVARQLCSDPDAASSLLLPISRLEPLLRGSVEALPVNELRIALQKDFKRFVVLLQDEIKAANPDLAAPSSEAAEDDKKADPESLVRPISVARGSLLLDEEYSRAAEAVILAAEQVQSSANEAREWRLASERILEARTNPPLPLFWAHLTLSMHSDPLVSGEAYSVMSVMQGLWERLKAVIAGLTDPATAVAAIAPLIALLFDVLHVETSTDVNFMEEKTFSGKNSRRFMKSLNRIVVEISSFVLSCRRKKHVPGTGLLMYRACNKVHQELTETLERTTNLLRNTLGKLVSTGKLEEDPVVEALPLVSTKQRKRMRKRARVQFLADAVSEEIFLLQLVALILEFRIGSKNKSKHSIEDFKRKLKLVAVHGAANTSLPSYEMLLDVIMELPSPFHGTLIADEETLLKEALYEAVISVEPSHLQRLNEAPTLESNGNLERASVLFLKRLAVFRHALRFYRLQNLWARADSLLTRAAPPCAPSHLVRWLNSANIQKLPKDLKDSRALTDWLLKGADEDTFEELRHMHKNVNLLKETKRLKGRKLSDGDYVPLSISKSSADLEDSLFYVDKKGEGMSIQENEETELEAIDRALITSAKQMWDSDNKNNSKTEPQIFFHRYHQSAGTKRPHHEISTEASDDDEATDDDK